MRPRGLACRRTARSAAVAAALMAISVGFGLPAVAQSDQHARKPRTLPPVEISALRDPVSKSYRKIVRGMEVFERHGGLAPAASLRFRLVPKRPDADMKDVALRIVGETVSVPIPVAPDRTFTVPRIDRALEEDAMVEPNRRAGSMTWRIDIRTPGLPADTRRLGDLRLECRVGMESGLISDYPPSILDGLGRLFAPWDYCGQSAPRYLFFADRPLWSVTLVHGARRQLLPVDRMYAGASRRPMTEDDWRYCDCAALLDRTFFAPLGDASWPDDTLLEFEYMDEP